MGVLGLERDLDGTGPEHRWARWNVRDDDGRLVGLVVEERAWAGEDFGPSTYAVAWNPSGEAFGAQWRSEGHASPAEALGALADHLARGAQ